MKKTALTALSLVLFSFAASAQEATYLEEVQSLGAVAGQGLACNASKYDNFELLARAIMVSKAPSDAVQAEGMKAYNEYKATAFISKMRDGLSSCAEINNAFNQQSIFKATLYGDGTLKMPDGKIITPRKPYDATLIYQKDPEARQKYMDLYQEKIRKTHADPAYQKALRERMAQDPGF